MANEEALEAEAQEFRDDFIRIREEVGKLIVGQERVVEATLTAVVCGGNVLLEGVPGLGKTMLVKTLGQVLDLEFRRIQFTPDLMPADIIGTTVMTADPDGRYRFEFRQGPIFTQLLLADEINRATPKTQSALLETMQEISVTVGGTTYHLEEPFFVLATQNPIEQEGTYPLPEAQLDRFMFKASVPFLNRAELNEVVNRTILKQDVDVQKVMDGKRILELRKILEKVVVTDQHRDYAVRLVLATHGDSEFSPERVKKFVRWGASPRASQALILAARVRALADGRAHVSFDDVRHYADEVLQHRVLLNYDGQAEGIQVAGLVRELLEHIPEEG
ncbi:MAG TPA: MoxR family ATPase [Planctomycetota bacterium]|nr:MoxR family ATPase [Planctomycetota bacterium]